MSNLDSAQRAAADVVLATIKDSDAATRLECSVCWAIAESDAAENGASVDEVEAWAAIYIGSGDSEPCTIHDHR